MYKCAFFSEIKGKNHDKTLMIANNVWPSHVSENQMKWKIINHALCSRINLGITDNTQIQIVP